MPDRDLMSLTDALAGNSLSQYQGGLANALARYSAQSRPQAPWEVEPWRYANALAPGRDRPQDLMAPVSEAISPTMGAYGMGQSFGNAVNALGSRDPVRAAPDLMMLAAGVLPGKWNKSAEWIHGTSGTHTKLDASKAGSVSSGAGRGIWLADPMERLYASEYAQNAAAKMGGDPRILRYSAPGVENPLVVEFNFDTNNFRINGRDMPDLVNNIDVLRYAEGRGHDAVHWVDGSRTDPASLTVFDGNKLNYLGD